MTCDLLLGAKINFAWLL